MAYFGMACLAHLHIKSPTCKDKPGEKHLDNQDQVTPSVAQVVGGPNCGGQEEVTISTRSSRTSLLFI